jgi:hypothetical protein
MEIDLKELEEKKERNRRERLQFIELQVEWLKRTPNGVWSKQQAEFINAVLKAGRKGKESESRGKGGGATTE